MSPASASAWAAPGTDGGPPATAHAERTRWMAPRLSFAKCSPRDARQVPMIGFGMRIGYVTSWCTVHGDSPSE
eukprot:CAMPEP_0198499800 /NCGR_PEP_ID=MMETSP1462-20131121/7829_1 /TAXON_ID=1333877 /ORGANISM="Brandtodinium nutriculum, Strain RCC3387" /LENGTH=72 /DNA_ID=CAMNT_0044228793 /DNA_START=94 /DNA_END=312 /DNA_ORIENTATION=+